jgi:hypothetical protein
MDGGKSSDSALAIEELEALITELAGQLNAAQYRWLTLIAQFDRREGWAGAGLASCAHWLNFKCGLNLGAAREKVRVAHALKSLPRIAEAMARGSLSYSKVRAVTRVACAATEENLLNIALHGTAHHIETIVRLYRRAQQAEELSREARQQANRSVEYHFDEDDSLVLKARLPAVAGAMVLKALEAAMQEVPASEVGVAGSRCEEETLSYQARRADALALVAEGYLHRGRAASGSADCCQVVLHVDAESLKDHSAGRCHLEEGPSVPIETARRLACDASLLEVLETERGVPLDVGRKRRTIPSAIRRALHSRDAGCRFPGCTYRRYIDAHHIEHWADGGETKLKNLLSLCRWHHRLVHEGGLHIEDRPEGGWRFIRPDGREFDPAEAEERDHEWTELERTHEAQGIRIDSQTAVTRWCGERIDYDLGVWVLCNQAERARNAGVALDRSASAGDCIDDGDLDDGDVPAETLEASER